MKSIRQEIRDIVDRAHREGRPIHTMTIWGSLTRDIAHADFVQFVRGMAQAQQLVAVDKPARFAWKQKGRPPIFYAPGPNKPTGRKGDEAVPALMGFREYGRIMEARKAARTYWREGRHAA